MFDNEDSIARSCIRNTLEHVLGIQLLLIDKGLITDKEMMKYKARAGAILDQGTAALIEQYVTEGKQP